MAELKLATDLNLQNNRLLNVPDGINPTDGVNLSQLNAILPIDLTTDVTGILPISNGGTGLGTLGTAGQLLKVNTSATGLEYFTDNFIEGSGSDTEVAFFSGSNITSSSSLTFDDSIEKTLNIGYNPGNTNGGLSWVGQISFDAFSKIRVYQNYGADDQNAFEILKDDGTGNLIKIFSNSFGNKTTFGGENYFTRAVGTFEVSPKLGDSGGTHAICNIYAEPVTYSNYIVIEAKKAYYAYSHGILFRTSLAGTPTDAAKIEAGGVFKILGGTSAASPSYSFINDANTGIFSPSADNLAISTGGTERLRIDNSGNVGIGATSPGDRLYVSGDLQITGVVKNSDGAAASPSYTFTNATNFGLYYSSSALNWSTAGLKMMSLDSTKLAVYNQEIHLNSVKVLDVPNNLLLSTIIVGNGGDSISHTTGSEGYYNTAVGIGAFNSLTTGYHNVAVGYISSQNLTSGNTNTAIGSSSMNAATTAVGNFAGGYAALNLLSSGIYNTAVGSGSLGNITTTNYNVGVGFEAGKYYGATGTNALSSATKCIYIGYNTRASANTMTNEIVIGADAVGNGNDTITLGNSSTTDTYINGDARVSSGVKLGTTSATDDGFIRWTGTDFEGRKSGSWVSLTNTGNITGTGTTGWYPVWNGNYSLANGALQDESTYVKCNTQFASYVLNNNTTQYNGDAPLYLVNTSSTNNTWISMYFAEGVGFNTYGAIELRKTDTTNGYGGLYFSTKGSGGLSTKMIITKDGEVGIGTTSPSDKLHVSGSFRAGGAVRVNHTTLSANTTLDETTHYIVGVSAASGAVTITLPASPVIGRTYIIYKSESSANAVTVSGNGNNINGAANYTLNNAYDKIHIVYSGAEWIII